MYSNASIASPNIRSLRTKPIHAHSRSGRARAHRCDNRSTRPLAAAMLDTSVGEETSLRGLVPQKRPPDHLDLCGQPMAPLGPAANNPRADGLEVMTAGGDEFGVA